MHVEAGECRINGGNCLADARGQALRGERLPSGRDKDLDRVRPRPLGKLRLELRRRRYDKRLACLLLRQPDGLPVVLRPAYRHQIASPLPGVARLQTALSVTRSAGYTRMM